MTKEEKELLFKDLCARLQYGLKVWYKYYSENVTEKFATSIRLVDWKIALSSKFNREGDWYPIEEANELLIKPYLRPLSSMTEEEREELEHLSDEYFGKALDKQIQESLSSLNRNDLSSSNRNESRILEYIASSVIVDWLNTHHFDYRGLIERGLAIEAPERMYNIKNK